MGVTTKTGDKGQTSLFTGERVDKDHRRVEVYGNVEREADEEAIEKSLPPLRVFRIPGETKGGAMLDFARTTARTAERRAWSLRREEDVHEIDIRFLNRMSDYIFLLMRLEEQDVRDK